MIENLTLDQLQKEGRRGLVVIEHGMLAGITFEALLAMQSFMFITDIIHNFAERKMIFVGFSDKFEKVPEGGMSPVYMVEFNTETKKILVTAVKNGPQNTAKA